MAEIPRTPAQLEPYVDALGVEGTISFLLRFGGSVVYITDRPSADSMLCREVGVQAARRLARALRVSREFTRVPLGKEWSARVLSAQGLPVQEIARTLHVTDVTVRRYLKSGTRAFPDDPRQHKFPGF